jgi:hypothetical protein
MRLIKVGADFICLGVAIKPKDKDVFSIEIAKETIMFVTERFLLNLLDEDDKHLF